MPNIWTNTSQKVYEIFYGPKTRDTEFDIKIDEMKMHEKSFLAIKAILYNFPKNTGGIKNMCRDVYNYLTATYGEGNPYAGLINEISNVHKEIERLYDNMTEQIRNIAGTTAQWDKYFEEARVNLVKRDNFRRTYDHYDEKMEKLVRTRNEKLYKRIQETPKEMERFDRNDAKYKKATDDFVKQSGFAYSLICELIDFKYRLINPTVVGYVNEERKFFTAVGILFKKFENFEIQMKGIDSTVTKSGTAYNPAKYVRGYKILQGVNVNELPNVQNAKKTEKYSYEEYLKSKNQNPSNTGQLGNQVNVNIPNTKIDNNPSQFSYEQYRQTKQLNKSSDNIYSPEDNNKVSNSFNNINLNNNLGPTSTFNNIPESNHNNPHNFLNFELTKQGMNQTTLLTPIEDNLKSEQMKDTDSFNPYSALSFDNTPQQPKSNYGASYMPGNYNNNSRPSVNNNQSQMNMNSSNIPGRNFTMPNYNNGYSQNNYNLNNQGNYNPNNYNPGNQNNNNPGNQNFPK